MITQLENYRRGALLGALVLLLSICVPAAQATDPTDAAAQLRQKLADLLAHPALRGAEVGACVVSVPDGEPLYGLNQHQPFTPASTVKVLVTASALRLLVPDFVYHTSVWTATAPTEGGTIPGDLFIAGTADPAANTAAYARIAQQLTAQGVTGVAGGIVGAGAVAAAEKDKGLKAARALLQALARKGVPVGHQAAEGAVPPGAYLLYRRESTSLRDYIHAINIHSNNRQAELLLSSLTSSFGNPHDPDHGFIGELWQEHDLDVAGLRLIEGSGLSHRNKMTPALLTGVLTEMAHDEAELQALVDSLPVAGLSGTLSGRMRGTVAEARVYAKTGTLKKVSCLAGYVCVDRSPGLAFALMMNGYSCSLRKARAIQDQAAIQMVKYALAQAEQPQPVTVSERAGLER